MAAGSAGQNGLPFYLIAAATSVAMSFIAHEGKVSFECCRPHKPTSRLSLARSRHFVWAPDPDCHVVVWWFRNRYRQFEFTSVRQRVLRSAGFSHQLREKRAFGRNSALQVLFATFESLGQALLILLDVPFALIGGIAALWLRGMNLNLSASVGFIALFGVAVLNGIVMVSHINMLSRNRASIPDAIRKGAADRLRPVLITALVASLGFIPMAIATSTGAEVQRPLATVVIGGLITSTFLTLYLLPIVYPFFSSGREHRPSI